MDVAPPQAKTPLITPRFGLIKQAAYTPKTPKPTDDIVTLKQDGDIDDDPWIPTRTDGASDIRIAAITPIGTIAMVPTIDKRPPTPRRFVDLRSPRIPPAPQTPGKHLTLKVIDPTTKSPVPDPILTATIYLDLTKPKDRDYNYVPNRMRAISENTLNLQRLYKNDLKPVPQISGRVSKAQFEDALSIYENNQVYYQDRIDDHTLDMATIRSRLTELDHWFMCIIEPRPSDDIDGWKNREKSKLIKGVSPYCDPELHTYIGPLPATLRTMIYQYHLQLGI
jgi:hypothetical protein